VLGFVFFIWITRQQSPPVMRGKITLAGKPFPAGWIVFHSPRGAATGSIDKGTYRIEYPPVGEDVVIFIDVDGVNTLLANTKERVQLLENRTSLLQKLDKKDPELVKLLDELKKRVKIMEEAQERIKGAQLPERYTSPQKSPLRFTAKRGEDDFDIELEK
jgi:hypothetical protein